ncbi:MAG TPA: hypothetical protein VF950_07345 [Planctomycetota bacterium]
MKTVWVISHCEVYLKPGTWAVDEMPQFVASSKDAALRLIRATWVDPGTWWRLEEFRVDDFQVRGRAAELYSREGRPLRSEPRERGYRAAIARYRKDVGRIRAQMTTFRSEGRPKRDVAVLEKALRSTRSCLKGHA